MARGFTHTKEQAIVAQALGRAIDDSRDASQDWRNGVQEAARFIVRGFAEHLGDDFDRLGFHEWIAHYRAADANKRAAEGTSA